MTHIKLTIDDDTLLDGDLGQWTKEPPGIGKLNLAIAKKEPWSMSVQAALVFGITHQQDIVITVCTRADGWSIDVRNGR